MQAVILAGGQGTRLRPLTLNTPKPIVPIGNQPFLLRQINSLKKAGIDEIILSLNYQPTAIEEVLGDGSDFGVKLHYVIEPSPMGTGGAYKYVGKYLNEATIVLNGDIFTDIDLQTVIEKHKENNATATIVLTRVKDPSAYGLVDIGDDFEVLRFLEKPKPNEIAKININTINAGIYILEPKVLDLIPENENYSFEHQLFPSLLENKDRFFSYVAENDYWLDIGTHERYLQAHYDLMNGKIKNFHIERNNDFNSSESAKVDEKSCIADGCVIGSEARIINSVLGENVIVKANAIVKDSVIWEGTEINDGAKITEAIIGRECSVGKNVLIEKDSVLGDKSILATINHNE